MAQSIFIPTVDSIRTMNVFTVPELTNQNRGGIVPLCLFYKGPWGTPVTTDRKNRLKRRGTESPRLVDVMASPW